MRLKAFKEFSSMSFSLVHSETTRLNRKFLKIVHFKIPKICAFSVWTLFGPGKIFGLVYIFKSSWAAHVSFIKSLWCNPSNCWYAKLQLEYCYHWNTAKYTNIYEFIFAHGVRIFSTYAWLSVWSYCAMKCEKKQ